jgi:glutathione synthase/RimK-type ligase-like ATP-grasp enzyme
MHCAILKNDDGESYTNWAKACEIKGVKYDIISMFSDDWLDLILAKNYDFYLACPPGSRTSIKEMYDEKIYILNKVLLKSVYPNFDEISLHENKKYLAWWLKAQRLPSQETHVFYSSEEAKRFVKNCKLPQVGKKNIGSSGKGVLFFRNKQKLIKYVNKAFKQGVKQYSGPNMAMGNFANRFKRILKNPSLISKRLNVYKKNASDIQKDYVILQEYIEHTFEWRIVKIGKFYFGHKKIKQGDKASGSKGIDYTLPSEQLLDFVRIICNKFEFNSMAIDIFETKSGEYLINEMQCIFGHVQDFICAKNETPGAFVFNNSWEFIEGNFNSNLSYNLRLDVIIEMTEQSMKIDSENEN